MLEESPFTWSEKIALDHPATNGHFAGNPIIPGSMILEYVRLALKTMDARLKLMRIIKAKFTHVLRPGEELAVTITKGSENQFRFHCTDGKSNLIASGEFCAEG